MGTKYNKMRYITKEIKLRIDDSMETDLRILYGIDKSAVGSMSFNQWLVLQFHKIIVENNDKLIYVKKELEPKLIVNGVERKIV